VTNLLHLAQDIPEEVLFLPVVAQGRDPMNEKQLRRVCGKPNFFRQHLLWEALKRSRMGAATD
jgi:hypothetical protein